MFPLKSGAIDWLIRSEPISHRTTALRHAGLSHQPGLWGNHPSHPSSLLWLRPGDQGDWEAFAAGDPTPALDWIEAKIPGSTVSLLAPETWIDLVRQRSGTVATGSIQTFWDFDLMRLDRFSSESQTLTLKDAAAFEVIAPNWALRSWGDFGSLVRDGLAIGLRSVAGFVSVAWTYESDGERDKIGVATLPQFRGLGLGRRVSGALIERIVNDRRKRPTWVTTSENLASMALAKSLGFDNPQTETLLHWTLGSRF